MNQGNSGWFDCKGQGSKCGTGITRGDKSKRFQTRTNKWSFLRTKNFLTATSTVSEKLHINFLVQKQKLKSKLSDLFPSQRKVYFSQSLRTSKCMFF